MAKTERKACIRLDLNNPVFQDNLLNLQKPERHSAMETLKKLRQMSWAQLSRNRTALKPSIRCASRSLAERRHIATVTSSAS